MLLALLCACVPLLFLTLSVQAATTEVHVVKYASDETTILNEMTVSYQWMEENLPVQGDGSTHYFFQGPIFHEEWEEVHPNETWNLEEDKWNWEEDVNVLAKDLGAVKGTNVKDLCELVGGMSEGDEVKIKAADNFYKRFPYSNVYEPDPRQGPMVVTWHTKDATESGEISGYVPDDYYNGMRLVFFADASTNPWEKHVFGISDMRACLPEDYGHYYQYPDYPSTGGYTIKYIDRILIYSTMDPLESIVVSPFSVELYVGDTHQFNATAYDADGNEMPNIIFTWTSSDDTVGTIDEYGLFTSLDAGETTITVANGEIPGTAAVMVHEEDSDDNGDLGDSGDCGEDSPPSPVLTVINVSPPSVTLNASDTQQFNASGYDQTQNQIVSVVFNWTSSNETVGTVNKTGFFIAIASGTTAIKAVNGTVNGTANVTVLAPTTIPSPTETPQVNVTPSPSPTPHPHPTQTHSPSATVTPASTPAVTSTPTPSVPGFETIFTIIGLLAVAYVIKRRKNIK